MVNAGTVPHVIRTHRARPLSEANEEGIPRGEIDFAAGLVRVEGRWLAVEDKIPAQAIASDARILADYLDSFHEHQRRGDQHKCDRKASAILAELDRLPVTSL